MVAIHIIVDGAPRAADWYAAVFGAAEDHRITLPDGRLIDVELRFGASKVVLADEFAEHGAVAPTTSGQSSAVFYVETDNVETLWERAIAHGARPVRPLADWFTGDRDGQIVDPFGHRWGLSQHVRDVPREEVSRAAADMFGGAER